MRTIIIICLALLCLTTAAIGDDGISVSGATEADIRYDCRVTAEIAVQLMMKKAKTPPDKLLQYARQQLVDKEYKGSFGDIDFVASMYTGSAIQSGEEVDLFMKDATQEDLELMKDEHEYFCLKDAKIISTVFE